MGRRGPGVVSLAVVGLSMLARPGWAWTVLPGPAPTRGPVPEEAPPAAPSAVMSPPGAASTWAAGAGPRAFAPMPLVGPFVSLRADNPRTRLQVQVQVDDDVWRDVCQVPCGLPVDPSQVYRVTAPRLLPTDPFSLPRSSGQVTIDAHLGWRARNIAGRVFTPAGGALMLVGMLLYLGASHPSALDLSAVESNRQRLRFDGAVVSVAGLGVAVAGLILWRGNLSSADVQ